MSFLSRSTAPPRPKTRNTWLVSLLLAAFFVVMIVGQLFTFEDFPAVLDTMWIPLGEAWLPVVASMIVTFEVLALPFLLGLRLSVAMRVLSMVFGWLAILTWLVFSLGNNLQGDIANSGFLGATVVLPAGWWTVLFCVALGILAAWAAWGMWPLVRSKK